MSIPFQKILAPFFLTSVLLVSIETGTNATPSKLKKANDNSGSFKRPGTLQIIDNDGSGSALIDSAVGIAASVSYTYGPFAGPNNGLFTEPDMAFANGDRGYWEGTNLTTNNGLNNIDSHWHGGDSGSPPSWAVATKTRHLGIYYQSNNDVKNASSAITMFKYRIEVSQMKAGYYRNTWDLTGPDSSCVIELTFPNVSAGSAPPPLGLTVTSDEGITGSISTGPIPLEFNWSAGPGWGEATGSLYNISMSNPGSWNGAPHTAKSALQSTAIIGSRGKISVEEVNTARAYGTLTWKLFTEQGNKQLPLRFPPPAGALTAIRFNP